MFLPRCCSVCAFVFKVMSHNPEDEGGTFLRNLGKQLSKYGEPRRPVSSILKQVCNKNLSALCHSQWAKRQPCRHTSRTARCSILSLPFDCHANDKNVSSYYTGQQNLTFFLAHEEKYLILIELLTLNSNV